jgi:tetratricopeptide (TPR) repeat protein
MKRALTALVLLLAPPLSVVACLWDRDTPDSESKGMPEVVAVLTGRFERNPPLFYEMRLERVSAHLQSHPEDLAAYDDAGVACDRLGRGDEAIAWMEKKRAQLDPLDAARPEVKEQLYRYHANLGTFLVHRWARQGGDRSKIDEVKAARNEIAKALEINPNAHFGREKYQLQVLDWIMNPPKLEGVMIDLPNVLGWSVDDIYGQDTDPKEADDAVRGLAGLVVLGNAWESVDIFHALNIALQRDSLGYKRGREGGRNSLAYLAWLRCRELIDTGKGSMLPDAPKGEALKGLLRQPGFVEANLLLDPAFTKLRAEADAWHTARTAFMMKRLNEGRHPDTDPGFWNGYTEKPAPALPTRSVPNAASTRRALRMRLSAALVIGVPVFAIAFLISAARSRARQRKAQRVKDGFADYEFGIR